MTILTLMYGRKSHVLHGQRIAPSEDVFLCTRMGFLFILKLLRSRNLIAGGTGSELIIFPVSSLILQSIQVSKSLIFPIFGTLTLTEFKTPWLYPKTSQSTTTSFISLA